jgi:serine/threonine protein kinase
MKIYNNLSNMKKQLIIKNLDNLYKLNHKNIIKSIPLSDIDINEENEDFILIYEYFNSKNIEDMINNFGSLDEKIIQIYIKQLLEGLKYS